uniref:Uncharacterized protein n=1 Tax=Anguilla anguilla TaxID=7936 RepID=A0A0E9WS23_ANGAN
MTETYFIIVIYHIHKLSTYIDLISHFSLWRHKDPAQKSKKCSHMLTSSQRHVA